MNRGNLQRCGYYPPVCVVPTDRRRVWLRALLGALVAGLFVLMIRVDMSVMAWLVQKGAPFVNTSVWLLRRLAEAQFLVALGAVLLVCDRRGLTIVVQMTAAIVIGFVPMVIGKACIHRQRPIVFAGHYAESAWNAMWKGLDVDWARAVTEASEASMPSGHSYTAMAVAVVLSAFYGKLRALFIVLALGTATSRVLQTAHWPSDCLAGLVVGVYSARLALRIPITWRRRPA